MVALERGIQLKVYLVLEYILTSNWGTRYPVSRLIWTPDNGNTLTILVGVRPDDQLQVEY
jgi:hypothetical protein